MTVDSHPPEPTAVRPGAGAEASDWSRDQWTAHADKILAGAHAWASVGHGRITPPGAAGGYGYAVDGLEGFARTFLLAGFRIAGERGIGVDHLIDFYVRGVTTGVDPSAPDRWIRLEEHAQAKVEAASIALILDMTREWIWERLDVVTQERVIDYLAPVVGDDTYPQTNWVWFRIVVQTFLRSVGGPWSENDIADDLARHDSFLREGGWMSDGAERSYDHYVGWALHVYPVLWSRMTGAKELSGARTIQDTVLLDRFLRDAVALIGADGSPLLQGRSLIYRFAAAAPFWIGVLAEVPSLSPGLLRRAAAMVVGHFATHGAPDDSGILTMGWHHEWRGLAQSYSGPGSPYWAVKGMLGIMLPADHPVWQAPAELLPAETTDVLQLVRAAGWVISGTRDDGIVRIVNHGTDHAAAGTLAGESPLYARLGYSTATSPLLDEDAWLTPLEQSAALVDASGRATHRAGMTLLGVYLEQDSETPVAVAASTSRAHWVTPIPTAHHHGSGLDGEMVVAGNLTVHSIVRGAWEVRLSCVEALAPGVDASTLRLRIGGWPVSGRRAAICLNGDTAEVSHHGLSSSIRCLSGGGVPRATTRPRSTPLGSAAAVPSLEYPVVVGQQVAVIVELTGLRTHPLEATVDFIDHGDRITADVTWPDGMHTSSHLIDHPLADSGRAV